MPAVARIDPKTVFTPEEWQPADLAQLLARDVAGRARLGHDHRAASRW